MNIFPQWPEELDYACSVMDMVLIPQENGLKSPDMDNTHKSKLTGSVRYAISK